MQIDIKALNPKAPPKCRRCGVIKLKAIIKKIEERMICKSLNFLCEHIPMKLPPKTRVLEVFKSKESIWFIRVNSRIKAKETSVEALVGVIEGFLMRLKVRSAEVTVKVV